MKMKLLLWTCCLLSPICAQPNPNEAPKTVNPPVADPAKVVEKTVTDAVEAGKKVATMTPVQQREWMMNILEQTFRLQMKAQGFNDLELQEQVWNFVKAQNAARWDLRLTAARLRDSLADKTTDDKTLATLNEDLLSATETERARTETATQELSTLLKLDERPRLKAMLQLHGVIGDSTWFLSDGVSGAAMATFMLPRGEEMKAK